MGDLEILINLAEEARAPYRHRTRYSALTLSISDTGEGGRPD